MPSFHFEGFSVTSTRLAHFQLNYFFMKKKKTYGAQTAGGALEFPIRLGSFRLLFSKPVKETLTAINISAESQSVMRLYKPSNRFCLSPHVLQLTSSGIPTQ